MIFKDPSLEQELANSPLLLRILAEDFVNFCQKNFNKEPICTRIKEHIEGSSGVHEAYRGIDFRDQFSGTRFFMENEISKLLAYINSKYARNDGFPTMVHHSFQGGPFHVHLQIAESNMAYKPTK